MKKQLKPLGLKKQTISSLEEEVTINAMEAKSKGKRCKKKETLKPIPQMPQDPRPQSAVSRCTPCSDACS